MSRFAIKLQCPNPECLYGENHPGQPTCDRCQNPLTYRYLWAMGAGAAQIPTGTLIDCRYSVVSPQIWLDTQPGLPPQEPTQPVVAVLPYLRLYPHRLHLPDLFAIHQPDETQSPILLLNNAPIDAPGQLQPLLEVAWASATAVRQLNWLWQMLQLWQPLKEQGVVSSLLNPDNLHVEGWRLRLRELMIDRPITAPFDASELAETRPLVAMAVGATAETTLHPPRSTQPQPLTSAYFADAAGFSEGAATPSLQDLAEVWQIWLEDAQLSIREALRQLCQQMRSTPDTEIGRKAIADRLNQLLLSQAATQPLHLKVAGDSTTGTQRSHNEDACFPNSTEQPMAGLLPYVGIVCDGIGGHEGGEVASQMAVRSLQLQLRTWLAEVMSQSEPLPQSVIEQQLIEIVRVVNNLIAAQNDLQGRAQRQRMATTLVMAVQAPQKIATPQGFGNSHELYLVHVGDSRAYWLTPHACQQLTVDDDVTTREVRSGRSLYAQAGQRSDAIALTQALGTREGTQIKITVQRFVLDEDGLLLLCSDGLSDHGLVDHLWDSVTQAVLDDRIALNAAVEDWLQLANRHNGHDNASVVLMHCRVHDQLQLMELKPAADPGTAIKNRVETELTESAKALLYDEADEADEPQPHREAVLPKQPDHPPAKALDRWFVGIGAIAIMFILGALSIAIWRELAPTGFSPDRSTPVESAPEKSAPAESAPTNSAPEASPTNAAPTNAAPTDATSAAPAPEPSGSPDSVSTDAASTNAVPTDAALIQAAPTDATSSGAAAVESPLTEPLPSNATPMDATPADAMPTDAASPENQE